MKIIFPFLLAVGVATAEQPLQYSKVRIPVAASSDVEKLLQLGIAIDHFQGKVGRYIDLFLSKEELNILNKNTIPHTVLIHDWQTYYSQQSKFERPLLQKSANAPVNFRYGAMGGFLTYDEMVQQIDSMKLLFPNIISEKESIGVTHERRNIYAVKISDNPSIDEDEPEALYTALHHAREPQGLMTVMYYMWWLLENYGTDSEATYLVNNKEMWFIPVVNPDGYVYNQTIFPNGGGMHRKNRRNVGTVNKGVDLNRNYGPYYMWNSNNNGSDSVNTNHDTYRGPSPFSEPETFAIDEFMRAHNIKTCFNYHTYGNLLIYPWGYLSKESNDSLLFRDWAFDMTAVNRYATGTDLQTVQYSTRGNSDDYMYGDTVNGKVKTYAMTPEVGASGFWPLQSEIIPLAEENLSANRLLAFVAGSYPKINSVWHSTPIEAGKNFPLHIEIENIGLTTAAFTVKAPTQYDIFLPTATTSALPPSTKEIITVDIAAPSGGAAKCFIYVSDSAGAIVKDSAYFYVGSPDTLFIDRAETLSQWSTGNGWNILEDFEKNSKVFTDSPNGNYSSYSENSLTLLSPLSLLNYQFVELTFKTKWSIEPVWDFGIVEISTDSGAAWTPLRSKLSRKASGKAESKQVSGAYGYDGYSPRSSWTEQTIDISSYAGKEVLIRFRLSSDSNEERDGWYIDDITVLGYTSKTSTAEHKPSQHSFVLQQNYPNPFNPSTQIKFSIPENGVVNLSVYDILGRTVTTLIHQYLMQGSHSVNFNARQLSSGIYFYRLTAGNYSAIKKMTVLK